MARAEDSLPHFPALPVAITAAFASMTAGDPIFAAIEAHARAQADVAELEASLDEDTPDYCPLMKRFEAACEAAWIALKAVSDTMPITPAGVTALVGFMRTHILDAGWCRHGYREGRYY